METKQLEHGQKLTIKGCLERIREGKGKGLIYETWKTWKPIPFEAPKQGILIGKRTLCNGTIYCEGITFFNPKHYFTAYLVSLGMNTIPVYVRAIDIIKTI